MSPTDCVCSLTNHLIRPIDPTEPSSATGRSLWHTVCKLAHYDWLLPFAGLTSLRSEVPAAA